MMTFKARYGLILGVLLAIPVVQADLYVQDLTGSRLTLTYRVGRSVGGAFAPVWQQFLYPLDVTGSLRLEHDPRAGRFSLAQPASLAVRYGQLRLGRLDVLGVDLVADAAGRVGGSLDVRFDPAQAGRWLPGGGLTQRLVVQTRRFRQGSAVIGPTGRLDTELLAVGPRLRLGPRGRGSARWVLDWRGHGGVVTAPSPTAGVLGIVGLVLVGRRRGGW